MAATILYFSYHQPEKLEIDFLDVGQGDATLIKTPAGQNILIDGGPNGKVIAELGKNLSWWDRKIDLIILTHPHDDHVTGLIEVFKRYEVKQILYTGVSHTAPNYLAWLEEVQKEKIKLTIIDRLQTVDLGGEARLEILYPDKSFLNRQIENLNNSSIVVKLVYKKTGFLLTGDAETEVETELLSKNISANLLKIGHHGSDTASGENFLAAVMPNFAVISAGKDNDFGHPSPRTLKKLDRMSVKVFRTDQKGTVKAVSDGENVCIY